MLYRDIKTILTDKFNEFIRKSDLSYKIVDSILYVYNSCLVMEIYALESERVIYFGLYDLKNDKWCMDLDRIIGNYLETEKILQIYKANEREASDEAIASIKKYFYADLEILQTYLQNILNCDFDKYQKEFAPVMPHQIEKLRNIGLYPKN